MDGVVSNEEHGVAEAQGHMQRVEMSKWLRNGIGESILVIVQPGSCVVARNGNINVLMHPSRGENASAVSIAVLSQIREIMVSC